MSNILISHVKEIAKISLLQKVDWSIAYSMWEGENPEKSAEVTPEDRTWFLAYVHGEADAEGNAIDGPVLVFKMDENGEMAEAD